MANDDETKAGSATTIGPTIIIRGRLKVDENLTVKGRIEAELSSSKAIIIENSGIVKADVRVHSAKVSGVLVGNVTAEEKIEIAPDGRVVGDLRAPRIVINDGAAFRGKIDMQNVDEKREPTSKAAAHSLAMEPHAEATSPAPPSAISLPGTVIHVQPALTKPKARGRH
jgi:cytoskeletal protein CcmA (bactofilin family)